jgi:hypothetical protein
VCSAEGVLSKIVYHKTKLAEAQHHKGAEGLVLGLERRFPNQSAPKGDGRTPPPSVSRLLD